MTSIAGDGSADPLARSCLSVLDARGQTLGAAESLTAGLVTATLATVPGASTVLRGGLTAYAVDVKTGVLGVDDEVLAEHGVYSTACAEAMAVAARRLLRTDWAVATTGVAGPDPDEGHPAGEAFVAVADPDGRVSSRALRLSGDRQAIRTGTTQHTLALLLDRLT
jgi:nicotinamide-nucleotide amidase